MPSALLPGLMLLEGAVSEDGWSARVEVAADAAIVAGHFPGEPVVPGIAHLRLALEGASALAGRPLRLASIGAFALLRVVRPGDVLDVSVRTGSATTHRFEVSCAGEVAARGTMDAE